ncbi:plastocyanin/azurin family copper-binding protein [Euzebya tangerina]|uniref:plastocyanin/azurin family copper-binding protein n=1 Tax=Euzebya tangerina TaxID=591198 RepID=UPI0013C2EA19|nr:plastocyanin/azurin family copper-binding protein [Euzebya tangerina]
MVVLLSCAACSSAAGEDGAAGSADAGTTVGADQEIPADDDEPDADPEPEPAGTEHLVEIEIFQFGVDELSVVAGDSVRWNNNDEIVHTVTSGSRTYGELGVVTATETDGLFDFTLDGREPDQASASFTFDEPGTYSMICTIHPGIDMTVEVSA